MRQVIDWKKIHETAANDPEYEFHWKYDGSYDQGNLIKLMSLYEADGLMLAEVVGFMKDRDLTNDETIKIAKEEARQAKVLFEAYAHLDFCNLTSMLNEHWTEGFDDECVYVKCSDYIDLDKHEYDIIDIQKIVKAFCDEALSRYMSDYIAYITADTEAETDWEPSGHFFHNGIGVDIDLYGVNIYFSPLSVYASDDDVVGVVTD